MATTKRLIILSALLAAALCAAVPAQASTINFLDPAWGPGGANSKTVGSVTVAASPSFNVLTWDGIDGFGVTGFLDRESDEVNNLEMLTVSFAVPTTVMGFSVTDLFYETRFLLGTYREQGYYRTDGGSWVEFLAPLTNLEGSTNGEFAVTFTPATISTLDFAAKVDSLRHDFSVASVTTVPEPASMLLLGAGLVGFGASVRRRLNR